MTIVGFSGRIGSGKTTAAAVFQEAGFERVSFADYMKQSLMDGLNARGYYMLRDDFYTEEGKTAPVRLLFSDVERVVMEMCKDYYGYEGSVIARFMALETKLGRSEFQSVREMLQLVGTEVVREIDPDFHVKKTLAGLKEGGKYVFDDVRFWNEAKAIEAAGGKVFRLTRQTNVSDGTEHASETALDDYPFDHIIDNAEWTKEEFLEVLTAYLPQDDGLRTFVQAIGHEMAVGHIQDLVHQVRVEQARLYGDRNNALHPTAHEWFSILGEQVGDVADMLNFVRMHSENPDADKDHLVNALVHVMAVAETWAQRLLESESE